MISYLIFVLFTQDWRGYFGAILSGLGDMELVKITAREINGCLTFDDGEQIRKLVLESLENGDDVAIDFSQAWGLNTSFVNGLFVELAEQIGVEEFKKRIKLVNYSKQDQGTILRLVRGLVDGF